MTAAAGTTPPGVGLVSDARSYEVARSKSRVFADRLSQLTGNRASITWAEQRSLRVSVRVRPEQAGHPVESLTLLDLMQAGDRCGVRERGAIGTPGYEATSITVWLEIDYATPEESEVERGRES